MKAVLMNKKSRQAAKLTKKAIVNSTDEYAYWLT